MGAMVIVVALALMQSMEKLEKPLGVRQQELADLHRARLVMQRAIAGLVVSDTTAPVNPNARRGTDKTQFADEAAKSAFEASEEQFRSRNPRPPARLLLEPDNSAELRAMLIDVGLPADEAQKLQRLEVVIDSPPIAPQFRAELADAMAVYNANNPSSSGSSNAADSSKTTVSPTSASGSASAASGSGGNLSGASSAASPSGLSTNAAARSERANALRQRFAAAGGGASANTASADNPDAAATRRDAASLLGKSDGAKQGALRGCFEIRPMLTPEAARLRSEGKPVMYELWWRPMPAAVDTKKRPTDNANPTDPSANPEPEPSLTNLDPRQVYAWGEPVLLADNLVKCNWQLYSEGQRRRAHNAVWEKELPAYVEFEIQTRTGLYANWMFEIGWTKGPELGTRGGGGVGGGGPASAGLNPNGAINPEARGAGTGAGGVDNSGTRPTGVSPTGVSPTGTSGNGVDTIDIRKKP